MGISKILSFDWALLFQWMVATTLGWILGEFLLSGFPLFASGVGVGILQWLVLEKRIHRAWRWALASGAGWAAGYLILLLGIPADLDFLKGVVLGSQLGLPSG